MSFLSKALLGCGLVFLAGAGGWYLASSQPGRTAPPNPPPPRSDAAGAPTPAPSEAVPVKSPSPLLAPLGSAPDWSLLDAYQQTITRGEFERLLTTVFTTGDAWREFITLSDQEAVITTGNAGTGLRFHLQFATADQVKPVPRHWRSGCELSPGSPERPLSGIHIAIDPGHLGGQWAKMEERWFQLGDAPPVCEGDLTLLVARKLKPELEALGATVSLVRNSTEPLTSHRPETLLAQAADSGETSVNLRKLAERLFYRTAEIRARAEHVNEKLKPDLVLCLHFNAEAWGNANSPTLIDRTHLHLLLNGGYTDDEVRMADQRFEMLRKLLDGTHAEEAAVGADVAASFAAISGLSPYLYTEGSNRARPVNGNPYLWARNLLANRLYNCPVIFMEPYVMNSHQDYSRIQAGDYEGLREVDGEMQPSIFREYVNGIVDGLKNHYRSVRPAQPPSEPER